ncbi:MAG: hypothetical protein OHK0037_32350 [Elainellaceae cyanobacterium]
MTTTLTIALPDDLAQSLQKVAQSMNLSIEGAVLQTLTNLFSSPAVTAQSGLLNYIQVAQMVNQIRDADLQKQSHIQIDLSPITLRLAEMMKSGGLVKDFKTLTQEQPPQLVLDLLESDVRRTQLLQSLEPLPQADDKTLPDSLQTILKDLKSDNPETRLRAIAALGETKRKPQTF